ncbi:MAG TPA: hypothetical protein VGT06_01525 [Candidatus Methylomirabilis sp.]|jgi:hypothetical protein|nr:hypothetical protein [Candidatus Methylomirabilis sp.]
MASAEQMLEAIGRWAEDAASREDEEALLAGLQRILVAYMRQHESTYVWGRVGEAYVKAQAEVGDEYPEEELGVAT